MTIGKELQHLRYELMKDEGRRINTHSDFVEELVGYVPSNGGESAMVVLKLIDNLVNKEQIFKN